MRPLSQDDEAIAPLRRLLDNLDGRLADPHALANNESVIQEEFTGPVQDVLSPRALRLLLDDYQQRWECVDTVGQTSS